MIDITYRQLILVAEQYSGKDDTLGYMLTTMRVMESEIQSKVHLVTNSVEVMKHGLAGDKGYYLTHSPDYVGAANVMERSQYALWQFMNLLYVYLANHHNVDFDSFKSC